MSNVSPIIQAFNAGRLGPRLRGRIDLAKYAVGCEQLDNFIPTVQGPVVKRPGTRHVIGAKHSDKEARLIAFEYSRTQAFILEFGNTYIRFHTNNGPVLETADSFDSAVTAANPVVVTANSHGYLDGDIVFITGSEQRELNDRYFTVAGKDTNTFQLSGENGTGRTTGTSGTVARVYTLGSIPYTDADVATLQFEQSNDVLYIASSSHPPAKISRISDTSWTYTVIAGDQPPFNLENTDTSITVGASAATGTSVTLTGSSAVFTSSMIGSFVRLRELYASVHAKWKAETSLSDLGVSAGTAGVGRVYYDGRVYNFANVSWWNNTERPGTNKTGNEPPVHDSGTFDDGKPTMQWTYVNEGFGFGKIVSVGGNSSATAGLTNTVCVVDVNTDGMELPASLVTGGHTYEPVVLITQIAVGTTTTITAPGHNFSNDDIVLVSGTDSAVLEGNNYTVSSSNTSQGTFVINGNTHGTTVANEGTVQRRNGGIATHRWSISAWSAEYGYPGTVAFHSDRLFWGGSASYPQSVWGSGVGNYENYQSVGEHAEGLEFTLSNQRQNAVEWMIGHEDSLFIGTQGGEFTLGSQNRDEALSRDNFQVRRRSAYGVTAGTQAVGVDAAILFPQRAGRKIHELQYQFESDRYVAPDLTELCEDILDSGVKGMVMQHEPYRVLWVWTNSGELRSLTYVRDQQVAAWATHSLGGSSVKVISAAVIPAPDGTQDQLWLLTERQVNNATVKSIEYLEQPFGINAVATDSRYLDSALSYAGESGNIVSANQSLYQGTVVLTVINTGSTHTVRVGDFVRIATCPSSPTLVGTVFKVAGLLGTTVLTLANESGSSIHVPWAANATDGTWEVVSKTITKAEHLEGETVGVLADGSPVPSVTVSGGTATLSSWASKVELGRSYAAKLKTLPIEAGTRSGTAQGKTKRINRLVIRTDRTGPGLEFGVSFDTMDQVQFLEVSDAFDTPLGLLTGDTSRLALPSGYDRTGQLCIRHQEPVPATIVALMPILKTEEGG